MVPQWSHPAPRLAPRAAHRQHHVCRLSCELLVPVLAIHALRSRGLTPRSRRGPTALHLARAAPLSIMRRTGKAQHRRSRLNSNVRQPGAPMTIAELTSLLNVVAWPLVALFAI